MLLGFLIVETDFCLKKREERAFMVRLEVDRSGIILFIMTTYGNNILSSASACV
jgi:hypothetical protein